MKRKPRDTSYSMTQKLLKGCGEERIRSVWEKHGMYKASEILSIELRQYISPSVIRYLSYKFNWIREVSDHNLPFVKGVLAGTMDPSYYSHVKIVGLEQTGRDQRCLSA